MTTIQPTRPKGERVDEQSSLDSSSIPHQPKVGEQTEQEHMHVIHASTEGVDPNSRTIIIPVDGSPYSESMVKWAKINFLRPDDDIVLIHVRSYKPTHMPDINMIHAHYMEVLRDSNELLEKFGQYFISSLDGSKQEHVRGFSLRGDPRFYIVNKAKELHADAIVIGSRGLGYLMRMFLGSVSDYVSHHADCPVIIVRQNDENKV